MANKNRPNSKQGKTPGYKPYTGRKSDSGRKSSRKRSANTRNADVPMATSQYTGVNDISWYSRNPELLAAAARIPFPYKPGMVVKPGSIDLSALGTGFTGSDPNKSLAFRLPGVCSLEFYYSIGHSEDVNSPASIAAREMYGRIRSKYSGALDADAPDIFMYCIALDQIHAYIAWFKRIYRCLTVYTPENRDYPEMILEAMGVDIDAIPQLQAMMPTLWGWINTLVHMANKFCVPDDMDIYHRHRWLNENVFTDEPIPASQSYVFNPKGFYFIATDESGATSLTYSRRPTNFDNGGEDLFTYGKDMIEALANWDDSYTINGYIMRAFEGSSFYTVPLLGQDEVLQPFYSEEVLTQIENFTGVGDVSNLDITQDIDTYAILHAPTAAARIYDGEPIINLHVVNPTAADVTIATRLMAYVDEDLNVYAGTEIPCSVRFTSRSVDGGSISSANLTYVESYDVTATSITTFGNAFDPIMRRWSYNHAPMCWFVGRSATNGVVWLVGDVCTLSVVDRTQLDEITRVCVYSEFNCFR